MTLSEPILVTVHPRQSTVEDIQRAARQGLFTEVEADLMIDRVRTHVTTYPADKAAS